MNKEPTAAQGSTINGGAYFGSIEELSSPKNQAVQKLLNALVSKKRKDFSKALMEMEAAGWDLNTFVLQDSVDSWFNIGSFLASRSNASYSNLLLTYLDHPGVDVNQQEGMTHNKSNKWALRIVKRHDPSLMEDVETVRANVRQPLSHIFLRQWAQYLPDPKILPNDAKHYEKIEHQKYLKLHANAHKIFNRLNEMGLNWKGLDKDGNSLCHVLVEAESTQSLRFLLPWLKGLGLSMTLKNQEGLSPSEVAHVRITRNAALKKANAAYWAGGDIQGFSSVISMMEQELLQENTIVAASTARRPRL